MLDADVRLRRGDLHLELGITVGDGELVALLGPNGAGKSTALRALAGLQPLDAGHVRLDDQVLDDVAGGVHVPPPARPIGVVFQEALLFPRLSVRENVAFGLRARGRRRSEAGHAADGWLERFGLAGLAGEWPRALSGGQAQRVALARALATEPRLLLLDEPWAALDVQVRADVRQVLRRQTDAVGGARLLVTHDPVDALVLADRIVVLDAGRVVQAGRPDELAARPASPFVADLVGVNLLHGQRRGPHLVALGPGADLALADPVPWDAVAVVIRPQAVALHRHRPEGSPRNAWSLTVAAVEAHGDRVRVRLDGPVPLNAEVTAASVAELGLAPGQAVWAAVKAVDVAVHPR